MDFEDLDIDCYYANEISFEYNEKFYLVEADNYDAWIEQQVEEHFSDAWGGRGHYTEHTMTKERFMEITSESELCQEYLEYEYKTIDNLILNSIEQ